MIKKIMLLLALAILFPCSVCGGDLPTLRLGILPVIDTLPLIVAEKEGFFEREDLRVELVRFNSALERDTALTSRNINGYFGDLLNTILLCNSGNGLLIVTNAYHTSPAQQMFALVAAPGSGITSAGDIGSVPVAISKASVIEYFLDEMTMKAGIPPESVEKMEIRAIPIRYQMLMERRVSLALLPEPLASKAIAGGAAPVLDDRNLDTTATVIAIKTDFLTEHPEAGKGFMRAYDKSVRLITRDPARFKETLVNEARFPASLIEGYTMHLFPLPGLPSRSDVSRVQSWLMKEGLLQHEFPYEDLVWEIPYKE